VAIGSKKVAALPSCGNKSVFILFLCKMIYIIIGGIIFFACLIYARFEAEKGIKELTKDQIVDLVQASSKGRTAMILVLMVLIIGFMLISFYTHVNGLWTMLGYFAALIVYYLFSALVSLRRVAKLDLPETYTARLKRATYVRLAGLAIFVIAMCIGLYQSVDFK
jgi:high-affinity K+ transport system ATPase subunit B